MEEAFDELKARYLNLLTDYGFHKVFGVKNLLIDFLNLAIREESLITDIQYLPPEQWGNLKTERKAIFDIFCTNEKGEYFIVEMQKEKQPFFRDRCLYYASLPIQKQAPRGIWDFRLKAVYMIGILDFVLFDESEEDKEQVVEYVYLVRERTKTQYSHKLKFVFIELPKFRKTEKELKTRFDRWLFILKNLYKLKERPASIRDEIFEELFRLAEIKQLTKKDMRTYKKSITDYHEVRSAMDCAREESREEGIAVGIEKGIEKGREREKIAVIQKCLLKNMSIDDIIDLTGFSKEQIMEMKTKN
ncbi:MAG: Rpn family recombination-promoting nuclease/putative transposase [Candidatus Azobacteroides sp.]|nr:Rpn family recombination-promoting nuclease/putative transposase [Candidatus Azobacteroides sp.]